MANTVPMLAPDGTSGEVPQDQVQNAIAKGFKQAVEMTSPDGRTGFIPVDRQQDALKAGFKLSQPSQAQPEGFWAGLQNYVEHPEQRGAGQPNALNRYAGGIVQTVGSVAQHPIDALGSAIKSTALGTPLGAFAGPQAQIDNNPIVQTYRDAKQNGAAAAAGHLTAGIGLGMAAGEAVGPIVRRIVSTAPTGQTYTPAHAAAFEGAIAPATAMGRNFIPQAVTPEALPAIRSTAARMAEGTPVEQGIVHAATSPATPPLERLGAYQKVVETALCDLENQHAPALAQYSSTPVDTAPLVKQLQSQISPTMAPADASAIRQLIMRVQQAKTIGDLNTFRRELNIETAPEYRQSQIQAGRSGMSTQTTGDLAGWVRNAYYDALQQASGTDFTPLKRQEANLLTTQEALQNQSSPLAKAEASFSAPSTFRETAGNLANVIKEPKTAVTQTILRESPATKISTLLRKTLSDLPPAPHSTGVPGPQVPQPAPAQIPAQTGGAYPMPGNVPSSSAMTAGEQAAAMMQYLRRRNQAALPSRVAPIPLPPPK